MFVCVFIRVVLSSKHSTQPCRMKRFIILKSKALLKSILVIISWGRNRRWAGITLSSLFICLFFPVLFLWCFLSLFLLILSSSLLYPLTSQQLVSWCPVASPCLLVFCLPHFWQKRGIPFWLSSVELSGQQRLQKNGYLIAFSRKFIPCLLWFRSLEELKTLGLGCFASVFRFPAPHWICHEKPRQ